VFAQKAAAWLANQVLLPAGSTPSQRAGIPTPRNAQEEDQQLQRALWESLQDLQPSQHAGTQAPTTAAEEDAQLQHALQESLQDFQASQHAGAPVPTTPAEEEAQLHQALQESMQTEEEVQLQRALQESMQDVRTSQDAEGRLQGSPAAPRRANTAPAALSDAGSTPIDAAPGRRLMRRASTGTPLYQSVKTEPVPDDGNCLMHSLVRLAGLQLREHIQLENGAALTPLKVRQHMASHLIDQFNAFNDNTARHDDDANVQLFEKSPYMIHLLDPDTVLDFANPEVQTAFAAAVDLDQLNKCMGLSAAQKTHVLHMAQGKTWHSETSGLKISSFDSQVGDVMPSIAASAFPGLRLSVITRTTTLENQDVHGEGRGPLVRLLLDGKHYEPVVTDPAPPNRT
jgi:hypothetical protein